MTPAQQQLAMDVIGSLFGLVCVWLTVKQNNWCWPTGTVYNVLLLFLCFKNKLYCDGGLQFLYIGLNFYGWYCWLYGGENHSTLRVSRASFPLAFVLIGLIAAGTWVLGGVMRRYTDTDVPHWDALTTAYCLVAQWMLAKKLIENWWVWIASNVSYLFLYAYKHLWANSVLQVAFIILSVIGYLAWRKELPGNQPLIQPEGGSSVPDLKPD